MIRSKVFFFTVFLMVAVLSMAMAEVLPDSQFSNLSTTTKAGAETTTSEENFALCKRRLLQVRLSKRRFGDSVSALALQNLPLQVYTALSRDCASFSSVAKVYAPPLRQFLQVYRC